MPPGPSKVKALSNPVTPESMLPYATTLNTYLDLLLASGASDCLDDCASELDDISGKVIEIELSVSVIGLYSEDSFSSLSVPSSSLSSEKEDESTSFTSFRLPASRLTDTLEEELSPMSKILIRPRLMALWDETDHWDE